MCGVMIKWKCNNILNMFGRLNGAFIYLSDISYKFPWNVVSNVNKTEKKNSSSCVMSSNIVQIFTLKIKYFKNQNT